jgi:hypothetical protein
MNFLRPLPICAVCLGLVSACAGRAPLPGPDPASVRTTIEAQIAQSVLAIGEQDTVVTPVRYQETSRR